jgi:glycosyltransferase involved in cell wall biosynthesis
LSKGIRKLTKISVVICGYKMERFHDTEEAVNSILAQSTKPQELIISVDHNIKLYEALRSLLPPIEGGITTKIILNLGERGFSATKNKGIIYSTGEIVAFLDDDAIADSNWLKYIIEPFKDPNVIAVGGETLPLWIGGRRPFWFPEELDWAIGGTYKGIPTKKGEVRNVPGGNSAFRKQVLDNIELFGRSFGRIGDLGAGEEAEFCLRLKSIFPTGRLLYEPRAMIQHKVPRERANIKYMIKRSFSEGIAKGKLKRSISSNGIKTLSTESTYMQYLFCTSIPSKLRQFYKDCNIVQIGTIMISIYAVTLGFILGRVRKI